MATFFEIIDSFDCMDIEWESENLQIELYFRTENFVSFSQDL